MRTIIAAFTKNQGRLNDRQGVNFVVESTIRALECLAVVVRGYLVPVGSKHALLMCAHRAPATACHPAAISGRPWQADLGTTASLSRLPQGSSGYPAGTGRYLAG